MKLASKIFTLHVILSDVTFKLVFKFHVIVVQFSVKSAVMVCEIVAKKLFQFRFSSTLLEFF